MIELVRTAHAALVLMLVVSAIGGCDHDSGKLKDEGGADECDVDQSSYHLWSLGFDGTESEVVVDMTLDSEDNVLITGMASGSVALGDEVVECAGEYDVLLAKLDPSGSVLWASAFGDQDGDEYDTIDFGTTVDVDGDDNIVVGGAFTGAIDFGGGALEGSDSDDIFVSKFDPEGSHLFSMVTGSVGSDRVWDIAVGADGAIALAGGFQHTVDFGGEPLTALGATDAFVAVLDEDGNHVWSPSFGCEGGDSRAFAVALDPEGNLFLGGRFVESIDLGGGALVNSQAGESSDWADDFKDVFLAKFDPSGAHLWSRAMGSNGGDYIDSIVAADDGSMIIAGSFHWKIDLGDGEAEAHGTADAYVARLDTDGGLVWSRTFGHEDGRVQIGDLAVRDNSRIVVSGQTDAPLTLGDCALPHAGDDDIFAAVFDFETGDHLWSVGYGEATSDLGYGVALGTDGAVVLAGGYSGTIDFGGGPLGPSNSLHAGYVAKLDPQL